MGDNRLQDSFVCVFIGIVFILLLILVVALNRELAYNNGVAYVFDNALLCNKVKYNGKTYRVTAREVLDEAVEQTTK